MKVAQWAAKRAVNIDRMAEEAARDDAALFTQVITLLDAQAHFLTSVGDEAGAAYVARLARLCENKQREVPNRKKKPLMVTTRLGRAP